MVNTCGGAKIINVGKKGIYMVGAWANKNQLLLGQEKVDDKSNRSGEPCNHLRSQIIRFVGLEKLYHYYRCNGLSKKYC